MSESPSPRQLPILKIANKTPVRSPSYSPMMRSTSKSARTLRSPKIPSIPLTMTSPRKKNTGIHKTIKIKLEESKERIKNLIESLERSEPNETIYKKSTNLRIFKDTSDDRSIAENKFMQREYPSYSSDDNQFLKFLMTQFSEAMRGVNGRFPELYSPDCPVEEQVNGISAQLDLWFTLFDECTCHISSKSSATALVLKNIMEVFYGFFLSLIDKIKQDKNRIQLIESYYEKKLNEETQIPTLKTKIEFLKKEVERKKKEHIALENENSKLHVEKFQLKHEIERVQMNVNNLLNTADILRGQVNAGQKRIHEMSRDMAAKPLDQTFGAVPEDVLKIWDQSSQFIQDILNNTLDSFDINELMPEWMSTPKLNHYIAMPRPEVYPRPEKGCFHFTILYKAISACAGKNDPETIFDTLELKVRELFQKFGSFYFNRLKMNRKTSDEHITRLNQVNKVLRGCKYDATEIIKSLFGCGDIINLPKKLPDIIPQIMEVFQKVPGLMKEKNKPKSPAEIISKTIQGPDLLTFIGVIIKLSNTDIFIDLFRKFLIRELPFHLFIFFSKVCIAIDKSDIKTRINFLHSTFSPFGYESIPKKLRKTLEGNYATNILQFQLLMLDMYQETVENLASQLKETIDEKDIELSAAQLFKLNELDAFELYQYMSAISENNDPTVFEIAICAFDKKLEYNHIISNFDPTNSKLMYYMNHFTEIKAGESPKLKKKKARTRPSSVRSSPKKKELISTHDNNTSSQMAFLPNDILNDSKSEMETNCGDQYENPPEMTDTGVTGDISEMNDIENLRIDARNSL